MYTADGRLLLLRAILSDSRAPEPDREAKRALTLLNLRWALRNDDERRTRKVDDHGQPRR